VWPELEVPPNVELVVDRHSPSAAALVSDYFQITSPLVRWVGEIDKNVVVSGEAVYLRNLVGAVKWASQGVADLYRRLKKLAVRLAFSELAQIKQSEANVRLIGDYLAWIGQVEDRICREVKVFKMGRLKVAVYETSTFIPAYVVCGQLARHVEAPFDMVCLLLHTVRARRATSQVELRTHTGLDVLRLARVLGGGGHRVACAATLPYHLDVHTLLEKMRSVYEA
jgi:hypothetical protein